MGPGGAEPTRAHATLFETDQQGTGCAVTYGAVRVEETGVLIPTGEGTIQEGRAIDRFGNPDLMARFAAQYLDAYRATMPSGRLPRTAVEVAPALHMLVTAAELALKADLMRSEIDPGNIHALAQLYGLLEAPHGDHVESQFARSEYVKPLKAADVAPPTVQSILSRYGQMYGGTASVYKETRYYAESTTKIRTPWGDGSRSGKNLVKILPYPVFMPNAVESLLGAFRYFHGAERLKRLGGDVLHGKRTEGRDGHGDWGLVPASLGLVALQIPQAQWQDPTGEDEESTRFVRWRQAHPPGYATRWMYGGKMMLFYVADEDPPSDADETTVDGLNCATWSSDRLGMHSRDLYLLANALEASDTFPSLRLRNAALCR